ncbi:hypothetical protein HDV00_000735 [Rhizophlyctis rosea]|nr:hypothetical protein HDV00_000735 [Rhizophlyctis rosea]
MPMSTPISSDQFQKDTDRICRKCFASFKTPTDLRRHIKTCGKTNRGQDKKDDFEDASFQAENYILLPLRHLPLAFLLYSRPTVDGEAPAGKSVRLAELEGLLERLNDLVGDVVKDFARGFDEDVRVVWRELKEVGRRMSVGGSGGEVAGLDFGGVGDGGGVGVREE